MRFPSRARSVRDLPGVSGPARLDRRTTSLTGRLHRGDIAVIDHLDLDRTSAEALVERGVVAVVNASAFISGRYPNRGPQLLAESGVAMVDQVGTEVFARLRDGAKVRIDDGALLVGEERVAVGRQLRAADVDELMDAARSGLTSQLASFTHNTTEFLRREQELLLHGEGMPTPRTDLAGRPVVVVVRDHDFRADLRRLRPWIREQRPVLVGVDTGADALAEAGLRPDVVVVGRDALGPANATGEKRSSATGASHVVADKTLRAARDVVVHTDRSGTLVGAERLDRLGIDPQVVAASGATGDIALLMADLSGASLIVTVGTHASLDELLDGRRDGLASSFLTRLRVGPKLIDAKGVPQLYGGRVRLWQLALVLLAGLVALAVALAATPVGSRWWDSSPGTDIGAALHDLVDLIQGLFS